MTNTCVWILLSRAPDLSFQLPTGLVHLGVSCFSQNWMCPRLYSTFLFRMAPPLLLMISTIVGKGSQSYLFSDSRIVLLAYVSTTSIIVKHLITASFDNCNRLLSFFFHIQPFPTLVLLHKSCWINFPKAKLPSSHSCSWHLSLVTAQYHCMSLHILGQHLRKVETSSPTLACS